MINGVETRVSKEDIQRVLTADGVQPEAKWALDLRDARAEIERLQGLLREHQYCVDGYCPTCNAHVETPDHDPDCPMAAALAGEAKP